MTTRKQFTVTRDLTATRDIEINSYTFQIINPEFSWLCRVAIKWLVRLHTFTLFAKLQVINSLNQLLAADL